MKLEDLFLDYLKYEKNYSLKTIECYREDIMTCMSFCENLEAGFSWIDLTENLVRQWLMLMMEQGYKATTVNRRLSALRAMFRFALKRGLLERDPVRMVQGPKKNKPLPYFLREGEMDLLLDEVYFPDSFEGRRDKLMLMLFYHTGVRLSELVGLDFKDVNLSSSYLIVFGKRRKERKLPFGPELALALSDYLGYVKSSEVLYAFSQGALFFGSRGRLSRFQVARIVKRYLSCVTTLKKKSPHVIRHTFATALLNHQVDLESVKELLGHESLSTTEIYTHTTFEELKKIYKQAHPRA